MRRWLFVLFLALPAHPTYNSAALPVAKRVEMIEKGQAAPGATILFAEPELNVYLSQKIREVIPEGLRSPRLEIGEGRATGHAVVNFVKMKRARGENMNWFMRQLLQGEHNVLVSGRLQTRAGVGRVDLDRVEIDGASFEGRSLDMLIRTFLAPHYPEAKPGQSFELGYDMDRIDLKPGVARVTMAPRKIYKQRRSANPGAAEAGLVH